jgi:hypothetical protein
MTLDSYLRVTEVLYPFSGLQGIDKDVLERAAKRGTRVHKICESIVEGLGEWGVDDEVAGYVDSFKKWWATGHKVVLMEKRFFCDDLGITGQVDLIIETPTGLSIVDLKTPAKPSKTWPLQGSAYAYMARKAGYDIKHIQFLQLSKYGRNPLLYEYEDQFGLFQKCLDVFNHFFRRKTHGTADQFDV